MSVLPLALVARRLGDRLHLLQWAAGDLPEHHQSLEAAIGWSYDLLPAAERRLFYHLGVFVGRVSLDGIQEVAREEDEEAVFTGMVSLAEWSLIVPAQDDAEDSAEPSFGMLETVRKYACDQLAARGELEAARAARPERSPRDSGISGSVAP